MGVNKVILVGNLTVDPSLGSTSVEGVMAKLRVATNTYSGGKEYSFFHDVLCYGTLAEQCMRFLRKGSQVYIEGELRYLSKENGGGGYIMARSIQFLDRKAANISEQDAQPLPSPPEG